MKLKVINTIVGVVIIICCLHASSSLLQAMEDCQNPVGTLISIQGKARVRWAGQSSWQTVTEDTPFCPGDMLSIGANGRATVILANQTILRIDQQSTVTFGQPPSTDFSILELLRGAFHIFSHQPRSLKVVTPYVNGLVEGTEFFVRVGEAASFITVFEGKVIAQNEQGELHLTSNQSAVATKRAAPFHQVIVRPRNVVAWTLYYPALFARPFSSGDSPPQKAIRRAATQLDVGRVDSARRILAAVLEKNPENSDALALSSIVATVRNNPERALELASNAVAIAPNSAPANLALSYARQSQFDIAEALAVLQNAAHRNPDNELIQARLAELHMSVGEFDQAKKAASKAVSLNPEIALSHTVLGFVHLSHNEIDKAIGAFLKAIEHDSVFPLARLGLGLSHIRQGLVEQGRADIEVAAALDPGNSLIRSYLGKAYFAEKRNLLSSRQYRIAKELDPSDPTPWFYDALRLQTINRPVEALHNLQQSITRNDNRAVYRSRLLLDGDKASRSAGLGRIYNDLGFAQLARREGWQSLYDDPANYSAHRFLADTYSPLPYHEVSRVSELLQAQLLQPLNITPVQPQLAETDITILEGAGPGAATYNEFNPLFLRNRNTLQTTGVIGSHGILGDELVFSGIQGPISYSIGQLHYETDGIRENNDRQKDLYSAFLQGMVSPSTSLMTEIRYRDKEFGDTNLRFNPNEFSSSLRQTSESGSLRLGMRHDLAPSSTVLATAIAGKDDGAFSTGMDGFSVSMDVTNEVDSQMTEVQHIYRRAGYKLRSGGGFMASDEKSITQMLFPFSSISEEKGNSEHANIYSYAQIDLSNTLASTIGFSADKLDTPRTTRSELNPKFGLIWEPQPSTVLRAASFKTLTRRFINAQSIEPTMVAGFNQYFDDFEATDYWTHGVGLDHTFAPGIYGGLQYYHRNLEVPYVDFTLRGEQLNKEDDWQEDIGSAYIYWAAADWLALGLEYYYEHMEHDEFAGHGFHDRTTHRLTPKIQLFHGNGLSARLQASHIDQEGAFGTNDSGYIEDSDSFQVVDISLDYRLPRRHGRFRVEVTNLFDRHFSFMDIDSTNPRFLQERQIMTSFTIVF